MNWKSLIDIGVSKQEKPILKVAKQLFNLDIYVELAGPLFMLLTLPFVDETLKEITLVIVACSVLFLPIIILVHKKQYSIAVIIKLIINCLIFIFIAFYFRSIFYLLLLLPISIGALTFFPNKTKLSQTLFLIITIIAVALFTYLVLLYAGDSGVWSQSTSILSASVMYFAILFLYKMLMLMLLYQVSLKQNAVNYDRYQFLFDNSNQGLILLENGKIAETNQTLINMLGYKEHELKNNDIQSNTPLAQITNLINNLRYADNLQMERIIKNKAEQPLTTIISSRKIDTKKEDENYSLITFEDVTKQRLNEEDMRHKKFVIEMLQKNFSTIYYKFDKNLVFLESVGSALQDLGLQENQVIGMNIRDVYAENPDIIKKHEDVKVKGFIKYDANVDVNGLMKYYTTRAFYDFESEIGIGLSFDVTDTKEKELVIENNMEQLNAKKNELEKYIESNLQLENFAYIASHDLQSPIRTIISFSQLLKRSTKNRLNTNELEYLEFIVDASRNMKQLVEDLLAYSLVDTQKHQPIQFNLQDLLKGIQLDLHTSIQEKNGEIIFENIPNTFYADKTRIRQLFQNLMSNALKFAKEGEIPKIQISCETHSDYYYFKVADNGIGIPKEFHEKIFLLFKKLHNNTIYKGTGIGLALVKKIVDQHNGKIWLDSEEGKGTTFHFHIAKN